MTVDPEISAYFRNLVKKRTDKNYGFNNPDVVRRAVETRVKNNAQKRLEQKKQETTKETKS